MKLAWIYLSDEINLIWVEKKLQPDVKNGSKSRIHFVTQCSENGKIVQWSNVFTNCESLALFYSETDCRGWFHNCTLYKSKQKLILILLSVTSWEAPTIASKPIRHKKDQVTHNKFLNFRLKFKVLLYWRGHFECSSCWEFLENEEKFDFSIWGK